MDILRYLRAVQRLLTSRVERKDRASLPDAEFRSSSLKRESLHWSAVMA